MNILRDADLLQNNDAIVKNELMLQIKLLIRNVSFDDPTPAEQYGVEMVGSYSW